MSEIDSILNSIHVFLDYPNTYDDYVVNTIKNDYTTPSEQVALLLRKFVDKHLHCKTNFQTYYSDNNDTHTKRNLLYTDFYNAFKKYVSANSEFNNKNVLENVDDQFIIAQLSFYSNIKVFTEMDGKKYLQDESLKLGYDIPYFSNQDITMPNRPISEVPNLFSPGINTNPIHNNIKNQQLREEPSNPKIAVSPWLQSTIEHFPQFRSTKLL